MDFKRIVIKVGSALVAPKGEGCSGSYTLAIAQFITACHQAGKEVILVSSGSVAAGRAVVDAKASTLSIATKQAMAAVGQTQMMANWQRFFDLPCAQLLITHGDLKDRQRYINIKNTLRILLASNTLPIVNENDTVATDELKVGDNDNLAALVALVSEADCLLMLSDVAGVYDQDPNLNPDAKLIPQIEQIDQALYDIAGVTKNRLATGGMKTKIQAAEKAIENGITTFILDGRNSDTFKQLLAGNNPGTCFNPKTPAVKAKKHWLKHTLKSNGQIALDAGAVTALTQRGASLLPSGVVSVSGDFVVGESVDLIDEQTAQVIAKGICQYSAQALGQIKGCGSDEISTKLGYCPSKVIVHRDDMVVFDLCNNS